MRSNIFTFIVFLMILSLGGCKKGLIDKLFENKSFVECNINGVYARGEGLRTLFAAPSDFHMNYSYNEKDTFTFNIAKTLKAEDGRFYKIYISFAKETLPKLGERYNFRHEVEYEEGYGFIDKFYAASVQTNLYFYQCADTSLLPKEIRKKRIMLTTNVVNEGYLEFTELDIAGRNISGFFEFEAEVTSKRVPEAHFKVSISRGVFEGRNIERDRTYYGIGLTDVIF